MIGSYRILPCLRTLPIGDTLIYCIHIKWIRIIYSRGMPSIGMEEKKRYCMFRISFSAGCFVYGLSRVSLYELCGLLKRLHATNSRAKDTIISLGWKIIFCEVLMQLILTNDLWMLITNHNFCLCRWLQCVMYQQQRLQ